VLGLQGVWEKIRSLTSEAEGLGVAQLVVEPWPSICKALSLIPCTTKK
jgi:hypothetical protein